VGGQVVKEKHEYKGDVIGATIGTGGGTLIGAVFSHVRGFGIGLASRAIAQARAHRKHRDDARRTCDGRGPQRLALKRSATRCQATNGALFSANSVFSVLRPLLSSSGS
jgi:hypothetical protein